MVQQLEAAAAAAAAAAAGTTATTTAAAATTTAAITTATTAPLPPSSPLPLPPRQPSGVPVYVMLPLDTVDDEGRFRYGTSSPLSASSSGGGGSGSGENGSNNNTTATATTPWFSRALREISAAGAHGVAVDVWWGAVERAPRSYDFGGYRALATAVREAGLRLQVVLSFHACGGNVGDDAAIPLPSWVEEAAVGDADLFYADAPRGGALGRRNPECVSLFADCDDGALGGRSPLQCYREFMEAFRAEFEQELGIGRRRRRKQRSSGGKEVNGNGDGDANGGGEESDDDDASFSSLAVIDEVVVGAGPCGELRYPSYFEPHGWRFPGVGEFQCHDRRARASLAEAARKVGRPEWVRSFFFFLCVCVVVAVGGRGGEFETEKTRRRRKKKTHSSFSVESSPFHKKNRATLDLTTPGRTTTPPMRQGSSPGGAARGTPSTGEFFFPAGV